MLNTFSNSSEMPKAKYLKKGRAWPKNFDHTFWIRTKNPLHIEHYHLLSTRRIIITQREVNMMRAGTKYLKLFRFCSHSWVPEIKPKPMISSKIRVKRTTNQEQSVA
jgi:hypothetical protein